MFETALEPDEIITKVSFPIAKKAGYEKFKQPGLALRAGRRVRRPSAARRSASRSPARARTACSACTSFEEALKKRFAPKSLEGLTIPADGMNARHPRQRRIPRPSGRRHGAPGAWRAAKRSAAGDGVSRARALELRRHARPVCRASRLGRHGRLDPDGRDKPGHDRLVEVAMMAQKTHAVPASIDATLEAARRAPTISPTGRSRPCCSWRCAWAGRCSSKARPASARPRSPRCCRRRSAAG